ncbi:MAG: PEGA domain-containing protein [Myxococcales bacterium]|nr:PEGA domain-containing protein [Myxococcales bacterium]
MGSMRHARICALAVGLAITGVGLPAQAAPRAAGQRAALLPLQVEGDLPEGWRSRIVEDLSRGLVQAGMDVVLPQEVTNASGGVGDCNNAKCFQFLSSSVDARFLVRTKIAVEERNYAVAIDIVDGNDGSIAASSSEGCQLCGLAEVGDLVTKQAAALRQKIDMLALEPAVVAITSDPARVTIFIDGKEVGTTPLERELTPGEHEAKARKPGYLDQTRTLNVVQGVRETLRFDLLPEAAEEEPGADARPRRRWKVPVGWTLLGVGVAGLAGGGLLAWQADEAQADFDAARTARAKAAAKDEGRGYAVGADVAIAAGLASLVGGAVLLWLADDEQRPDDALLRLRMTAGQEAAVVVVEPPYPTRAREGWMVQRWAWPSSWSDDLSVAAIGLRRIAEYARRRLPIRSRVVVAGEGAGATVALWAAQYGQEWSGVHVVAIDPQWPRALRSAAIPDDPSTIDGLELYGAPQDADLEGLRGVGLTPRIEPPPPPGGARDALVRRALGLAEEHPRTDPPVHPDPAAPMASPDHPLELTLDQPSPLSTSWAALYAALLVSRGHDARVRLAGAPATPGARPLVFDGRSAAHDALLLDVFAEGKGLPKTPDFFAGAVVLLVPASARPRVATRWAEVLGQVEASQGFIKTPYRAVREGDAAALTRTLSELRDRGRTEVLVVPVELCATGARMQRYLDAVEPRAEGLTLHWLPGLGHHVVQHLHAAEP